MNTELENIGQKVLAETNIPEEEKFGSLIALLMVISICITAIRVIQECNKRNHFDPSEENIYGDIKQFCNQKTLAYCVLVSMVSLLLVRSHNKTGSYSVCALYLLVYV